MFSHPFLSRIGGVCLTVLFVLSAAPLSAQQTGAQTDSAVAASGEQELRNAYRKEYAFLSAQKKDLEQRLKAFRGESEREARNLSAEMEKLQDDMLGLQARAQSMQERLRDVESERETAQRNSGVLRSTLEQAAVTFDEHGMDSGRSETAELSAPEKLSRAFETGIQLLQQQASVRREEGDFFTQAGNKVAGELIHFGGVASYGVADEVAGILVPAGGGEMKLWSEPRASVARALAAGDIPQTLPLFIYASRDSAVDTREKGGVLETIQSGGTIAWLIMLLAAMAVALIVARLIFLKRASASTSEIADEIGELVARDEIDQAIDICRKRSGSSAAVVASALRNLDREREALDDIINESVLHESAHLERFGTMILVIAAVSPLLGLLGTVTGMISTFEVITEHGTGDPQLLSGGISVALVTTELGLVVAIPTLLIGNMLSGWADRIKDDMQKAALRVINRHQKSVQERRMKAA